MKPIFLLSLLLCLKLSGAEGVLLQSEALPSDQTRYWSPGMTFCWHELKNEHQFSIFEPNPKGNLEQLDSHPLLPAKILPKNSYFIHSGPATEQTAAEINKELEQRWPEEAAHFKMPKLTPGSIISFVYYNHSFKYQRRFYRSRKIGLPFSIADSKKDVAFFGIKGELTAEYPVSVLDYEAEDKRFTLEIPGKGEGQTMVLMMEPEIDTFQAAINRLGELRKAYQFAPTSIESPKYHRLHEEDDLRIPYISFESETDFQPALAEASLRKDGDPKLPWRVSHATEKAKFKMDEFGAKVVVQDVFGASPFGGEPEKPVPYPRKFYFDQPFYVSLWMKDAEAPYFIAHIANFEDLETFKTKK